MYRDQKFKGVFDLQCKVIALTPRLLFAASGLTSTRATIPSRIDYDSQEVAQSVTLNFVFDPNWMQPNETIKEIAASWAWELPFRIRRGLARGTLKPPSFPTWITGVFAGLEPNGEISVAITKLEYNRQLPNMIVPPVSIVVHPNTSEGLYLA